MPLPKPMPTEDRDEFVSRCMSDDVANAEFSGEGQRFAVCQAIYDNRKSKYVEVHAVVAACRYVIDER